SVDVQAAGGLLRPDVQVGAPPRSADVGRPGGDPDVDDAAGGPADIQVHAAGGDPQLGVGAGVLADVQAAGRRLGLDPLRHPADSERARGQLDEGLANRSAHVDRAGGQVALDADEVAVHVEQTGAQVGPDVGVSGQRDLDPDHVLPGAGAADHRAPASDLDEGDAAGEDHPAAASLDH